MSAARVRLGVSACLLGERVRWDAGERRQAWLVDVLAPHVDLAPVCPEVGVGMGVPREPVQLEAAAPGQAPRLRGVRTGRDWTHALTAWAARTLDDLEATGPLAGFVLKARSPSCGLAVPVFGPAAAGGAPPQVDQAAGLFAAAARARGLPAIDEVALADPARRDAFLARAFTRARLLAVGLDNDLASLHAARRDLLRWLAPRARARLARLAAAGDLERYRAALLDALAHEPPVGAAARALAGRLRALRDALSPGERAVARAALSALRQGRAGADVPRACLRRLSVAHARAVDALLAPYPEGLLREGAPVNAL